MSETVPVPEHPSALPYRPCVGIMLLNAQGLIWIGRRRQNIAEDGSKWQMPQGGIDEGEDPARAALRELAEETGTANASILDEAAEWRHYNFPEHLIGSALKGKYCGQRQKWFAMRFLGTDDEFNIHAPPGGHEPEFDAWRWARADELPNLIVSFKRKVYEEVIEEFQPFLA